jgi:saccharopine dehydrogenase-like NADP-dependent oxidoreductase
MSVIVRYMFDNFFQHIDIDPKNVHILDGNAPDLKEGSYRMFSNNE